VSGHRVEWMLCDRVVRSLFTVVVILFATLYESTSSDENRISSVEAIWQLQNLSALTKSKL